MLLKSKMALLFTNNYSTFRRYYDVLESYSEAKGDEDMYWERFKQIEIGLNHATTETEQKDVIYLEQGEENRSNGIIAITVEEAEWLAEKLVEYANKFKK